MTRPGSPGDATRRSRPFAAGVGKMRGEGRRVGRVDLVSRRTAHRVGRKIRGGQGRDGRPRHQKNVTPYRYIIIKLSADLSHDNW